ncbi:hypothetical protein GCM10027436_53970 [Actinophytocola sediminis]
MYRVSAAMIAMVLAILVGVGVLLQIALSLADSPPEVLLWMGVGWLLFTAFMLALTARPATVVSGAGIAVRRVFGARRHPWTEIADIQIEEVSGQSAPRLQVRGAVIYDPRSHRTVLPYLHHRRLGPTKLEAEVAELRRRWETERGPAQRT